MELNFKLTYNIPKELIKALNITDDTIFCAYYCDGKLYVETVDDDESKEFAEDSDQDGDFSDSYRHGYEDGYRDGYHSVMHGEETPEQLFGDCEISDECDNCPFFCHACGTCNKDWEDEEDE